MSSAGDMSGDGLSKLQKGGGLSLKKKTIFSSVIVAGGHMTSLLIRFAGNLVLTRLLVPEMFGLMALVQTVIVGANLFSDMGIGQNIINHKKGADPRFQNTVWTCIFIRSFLLSGLIALLAYPAAYFWNNPQLGPMIIVVGLSYSLLSFESTAHWLLTREVQNLRVEVANISAQLLNVGAIIVVAIYWKSVWVLVLATLLNAVVKVFFSYLMLPGHRNWFAWDREAAKDIVRFGVWIFISSGVAFILGYADKVMLGRMITAAELGVYSIAYGLASMGIQVINKLANNTLFPVYSRLAEQGAEVLRYNIFRIRAGLFAFTLPAVCLLAVFGDQVIRVLYTEAYHEAGWMLKLMAIGVVGMVVNQSMTGVLLAKRDSKRYMIMQSVRAILYVGSMLIGAWYGGLYGLIMGMILAQIGEYPVVVWAIRPHKVWIPALDISAIVISFLVIYIGRMYWGG